MCGAGYVGAAAPQVWGSPISVGQPPKCGSAPRVWVSLPSVGQPHKCRSAP